MTRYLLDTSICVFLFRQKYGIAERLSKLNPRQCYISEITIAELKYGAYKSNRTEENLRLIDDLLEYVNVVPFVEAIDIYAKEKHRLRVQGTPVEDFDLLIAASAIQCGAVLVTDNTKHFVNIEGLTLENWVNRNAIQ